MYKIVGKQVIIARLPKTTSVAVFSRVLPSVSVVGSQLGMNGHSATPYRRPTAFGNTLYSAGILSKSESGTIYTIETMYKLDLNLKGSDVSRE
jgi:hypothetical protein